MKRRGRALRRRYGHAAPGIHSRDVTALKRAVMKVIGGRPYSGHVPVEIRVPVMRSRARGTRQQIAQASLAAKAVANYLRDIGDSSAERWDEMSQDLGMV